MKHLLNYGKEQVSFNLEAHNILATLLPNQVIIQNTGLEEVVRALSEPIGTPLLKNLFQSGETVAIITSDITRPMPSKQLLPPLLDELHAAGIGDRDITIVFALGSHRKHTAAEMKYLVGEEIFVKYRCLDFDNSDCINLGKTSRGTPVHLFRPVVEADRRICLGNIEYHYFAGYSGGAKAIMPGVATREAIQANHSMMVRDDARAGSIDDNPIRRDMDEVANFLSVDFILNVVLDESKGIMKAVAGHYLEAHQEGCRFLDELYKIELKELADVIVVSPGGYPKDINLYQAQKALDNARHAVREGGTIILVASCNEGLGERVFEKWMEEAEQPSDLINRIQQDFQLGGHKAAAIAMVLEKARVFLVSDLEEAFVRKLFLEPYDTVQMALDAALQEQGADAKIVIMPHGSSTLPNIM